jgi:hypothetical protein
LLRDKEKTSATTKYFLIIAGTGFCRVEGKDFLHGTVTKAGTITSEVKRRSMERHHISTKKKTPNIMPSVHKTMGIVPCDTEGCISVEFLQQGGNTNAAR